MMPLAHGDCALENRPGCRRVGDGMFRLCTLIAAAQAGSSSHNPAEKMACYAPVLRAESELEVARRMLPGQH